jgi:hypothetical protein
MKKLAMKLDDLSVETFHTAEVKREDKGTVKAQEDTFFWPCQTGTCQSCDLYCLPGPVSM